MTLFPLMYLSLLAHAVLRIFAGSVLFVRGAQRARDLRAQSGATRLTLGFVVLVELASGAFLIAGFLTQIAAALIALYALLSLCCAKKLRAYGFVPTTQFLLLGIALSLFITGAGAFAFDMPF